jgi:hypothetical protein
VVVRLKLSLLRSNISARMLLVLFCAALLDRRGGGGANGKGGGELLSTPAAVAVVPFVGIAVGGLDGIDEREISKS